MLRLTFPPMCYSGENLSPQNRDSDEKKKPTKTNGEVENEDSVGRHILIAVTHRGSETILSVQILTHISV
jgi:hypothetical protein